MYQPPAKFICVGYIACVMLDYMRCAERQIRAGPARPSDLLKRTSRTFSFLQARLGLAVWIRTKYVLLLTAVTRVTTCHTLKCQMMRLIPPRLSFMCDHSIGVSIIKRKSGRVMTAYLVFVLFLHTGIRSSGNMHNPS